MAPRLALTALHALSSRFASASNAWRPRRHRAGLIGTSFESATSFSGTNFHFDVHCRRPSSIRAGDTRDQGEARMSGLSLSILTICLPLAGIVAAALSTWQRGAGAAELTCCAAMFVFTCIGTTTITHSRDLPSILIAGGNSMSPIWPSCASVRGDWPGVFGRWALSSVTRTSRDCLL